MCNEFSGATVERFVPAYHMLSLVPVYEETGLRSKVKAGKPVYGFSVWPYDT